MTNFEKYKDEILKITKYGQFAKCQGTLITCYSITCDLCDFNGVGCIANKVKWLYKETTPALTKKERAFCEVLKDGFIARDESGDLYVFTNKPTKYNIGNVWGIDRYCTKIDDTCFPFIKWEDEKPWNIEDLLKLEVEDD